MFVLSEIFGDCPQVKILEVFAKYSNKKLYLTEIFDLTGINKITISNHLTKFLKKGIIEQKEKDGRIQYYQLNRENPKTQIILSLMKHIEDEHLEELIKKDVVNNTKISTSTVFTNDEFINAYSDIQSSSGYEPMEINSTKKLESKKAT